MQTRAVGSLPSVPISARATAQPCFSATHRVRQVTRSIRPVSSADACGTGAALSNAGAWHGLIVALLAPVAAHAEGWTCSAPGLVSGSYDGGAMAYIHLTGFPDGGTYAVLKSGSSKVTGVTKNGTKFTCIKK